MLAAGCLVGRCAASPAAAEVHSDVDGKYRAHATTIFQASKCAVKLDITNLLYSGLVVSCFLLGYYSLKNRKDQQFSPCFKA